MRTHVADIAEAEVQVADLGVGAIVEWEEAAGYSAVEDAGGAAFDHPPHDLLVEVGARHHVIRREVDEDQSVLTHVATLASLD
ncbi:unannotated protein [freshwater metagenome]|uniref:Unannotated protein n=1 Tax=freshwater metagenome TaxID=449393 RepID=A0A6J7QRC8_9ZZZZ